MNNDLKERLEILAIELRRQQKKYRSSIHHSLCFSVIILVFFSVYMALISYKIREIVTPKTVAVLIAEELRVEAANDSKSANTKLLAKEAVRSAFSVFPIFVPLLENEFRNFLLTENQETAKKIGESFAPALYESIDRILQNRQFSDAQLKEEAGNVLEQADRREMHPGPAILHTAPGFYAQFLKTVRIKDANQLSRQEQNLRDLILCYMYFCHAKRYRDTSFSALFEQGNMILRELDFIK